MKFSLEEKGVWHPHHWHERPPPRGEGFPDLLNCLNLDYKMDREEMLVIGQQSVPVPACPLMEAAWGRGDLLCF